MNHLDPVSVSRRRRLKSPLIITMLVILLGFGAGMGWLSYRAYMTDTRIEDRNARISDVLRNHQVKTIAGASQRLNTLGSTVDQSQGLLPLTGCTSKSNKFKTSFAYILSYDQPTKHTPRCSLNQVVKAYGKPNESALIAGSYAHPTELLLFYDKGAHPGTQSPGQPTRTPSTVVPIALSQAPTTIDCDGKTVVNIVAHQDDDLLFLSPDLLHDIKNGQCVRTVYLTAGDSGHGQFYWLSREKGSEKAYSFMTTENDDVWIHRIIKLSDHSFVTIATPRNNPKVSLVFMHLPDGNIDGKGFKTSKDESMTKLIYGKINTIHSVDGQSSYSSGQLISALATFITYFKPITVRTQSAQVSLKNNPYLDHQDHTAVGTFVENAYKQLYGGRPAIPLHIYTGYPIHNMPANLSAADIQDKTMAFLRYAQSDQGACQSLTKCQSTPTYGSYLKRQYESNY